MISFIHGGLRIWDSRSAFPLEEITKVMVETARESL